MRSLRLLNLGLQTLFGIRKQGYFIPYRYANTVPYAKAQICYDSIATKMQNAKPQFEKHIKQAAKHIPRMQNLDGDARLQQDWFPRLDAVMAYNMVATAKPKNIIEIGCGHSSRFMNLALQDFNIDCKFTAIDPSPRARLPKDVNHKCDYAQNIPVALFKKLRKNDIFFMDSSHILTRGSDVDFLLNGILPNLAKGVKIHIHDIFLPYDYPESWLWRGYNEQQAVAALLNGDGWKILWSSAYAMKKHKALLKKNGLLNLPLPNGAFETSIWLERI